MTRRKEPPPYLIVGEPELPDDFCDRLEYFKQAAGLTWDGLAKCLGVAPRQVQRWRHGTEPKGGSIVGLLRVAARVPDGIAFFLGEPIQGKAFRSAGSHKSTKSARTAPIAQIPLSADPHKVNGEQSQ